MDERLRGADGGGGERVKKSEAERIRARHHIRTARAALEAAEIALGLDAPPGSDLPQTIMESALNVATAITRVDAYQRSEESA